MPTCAPPDLHRALASAPPPAGHPLGGPWRRRWMALAALLCLTLWAGGAAARETPWARVTEIGPGPAEVIGSYASGCFSGGEALPETGEGFRSIRRWRKRHFGHPSAIAFVRRFATRLQAALPGPPVLVGDLSQARGGLMSSGHRSHQLGLDVDFWFTHPEGSVDSDDKFVSMVDERTERAVPAHLGDRQINMLRLAAEDAAVARIFVHWGIKAHLCEVVTGDRAWLHKIRAWYGHDRHFHVRLACPPGSPDCRSQQPLSAGDACGEERWFSRAEVARRKKASRKPKAVAKGSKGAKEPKVSVEPDKAPVVAVVPERPRPPEGPVLDHRIMAPERCRVVLAAGPGGVAMPELDAKALAKCRKRKGRHFDCHTLVAADLRGGAKSGKVAKAKKSTRPGKTALAKKNVKGKKGALAKRDLKTRKSALAKKGAKSSKNGKSTGGGKAGGGAARR